MTGRLKRRSSLGVGFHAPPTPPTAGRGPLDDSLAVTDDESERRLRHGRQKGRASLGTPTLAASVASPAGTPSAISGYSAAQLADHYTNCMKLSAENKISMKNAFQLKLIDYMAEMLKKKSSDLDNFQTASCALDASTKIYGYRVDSVHNETMKLASGVGYSNSQAHKGGAAGGDEGQGPGQQADVSGPGAGPKKTKKRSATVEKNLNHINCSQFELDYEIDPLFKKMSLQFDGGNGGGQFLSTLHMKNDSSEMLLDSRAKLDHFEPGIEESEANDESETLTYIDHPLPPLSSQLAEPQCVICPSFAGFSFRQWNAADEDEALNRSLGADHWPGTGQALENEEHAFQPLELADDYDEPADNMLDDGPDESMPAGLTKPHMPVGLLNIQSLRDHLSSVPSEYSYFDQGRLGAWAGPKHWKFKPMTKAPLTTQEARKAAKKKDKEKMDFHLLNDDHPAILSQVQLAMRLPKKTTKLQHKTMQNWGEERNILPEDLHYSGQDFVKLESMIKTNLAPRKPSQSQSVDDSVADYDFDNLNDTQNFCPDLGSGDNPADDDDDDDDDDEDRVANMDTHQTVFSTQEPSELGLVAAPNRVENIQIGYAKQAKKVDMRKLKSVEWSIILNRSRCCEPDKENEVLNDQASAVRETWSSATRFSDLYQDLKGPNKLPSKMVDSLSVPLAFVALLHLCNEETLALENLADFSDLNISKA